MSPRATASRRPGGARRGPATPPAEGSRSESAVLAAMRPEIGPAVPGWLLRVAVAAVGAGLAVAVLDGFWLAVALALIAVGIARPATGAVWAAAAVLGGSTIAHPAQLADPTLYVLIAGVHVLHLLASYQLVVPPRARLELAALGPSAARAAAIQVVAQVTAVLALAILPPGGILPAAGSGAAVVVASVALTVLAAAGIAAGRKRPSPRRRTPDDRVGGRP